MIAVARSKYTVWMVGLITALILSIVPLADVANAHKTCANKGHVHMRGPGKGHWKVTRISNAGGGKYHWYWAHARPGHAFQPVPGYIVCSHA